MSVLNRRINVVALALAGGISWGLGAAGLAVWAMTTGHGTVMVNFLADCYPYYGPTIAGAFWGALWGFTDLFCGLFLFALLYNIFAGKPKNA